MCLDNRSTFMRQYSRKIRDFFFFFFSWPLPFPVLSFLDYFPLSFSSSSLLPSYSSLLSFFFVFSRFPLGTVWLAAFLLVPSQPHGPAVVPTRVNLRDRCRLVITAEASGGADFQRVFIIGPYVPLAHEADAACRVSREPCPGKQFPFAPANHRGLLAIPRILPSPTHTINFFFLFSGSPVFCGQKHARISGRCRTSATNQGWFQQGWASRPWASPRGGELNRNGMENDTQLDTIQ